MREIRKYLFFIFFVSSGYFCKGQENQSSENVSGDTLNSNNLISYATEKHRFILKTDCFEQGKVVVEIYVNRAGTVIKAVPGVRGTTNNSTCLLEKAKKQALRTKFEPNDNAPEVQLGKIIYDFELTN